MKQCTYSIDYIVLYIIKKKINKLYIYIYIYMRHALKCKTEN